MNRSYKFILVIIFALAIYLRIDAYLINNSFFTDEILLAQNIFERNYLGLFLPLNYFQSAPYLFLALSKFVSNFSMHRGTRTRQSNQYGKRMRTPLKKCSLTADDGASPPLEWCTASAEMVHGGRGRGAPGRHAGDYSGMPLRLRMDSPSIWMV